MNSGETSDTDLVKYRVYQQRRIQAAKGEGFLLLTWMGLVIPLVWSSGLGYELINTIGLIPTTGSTPDPRAFEVAGAIILGGSLMLLLKPFTHRLRRLMAPHPGSSLSAFGDTQSDPPQPKSTTKFDALTISIFFVGVPTTFFLTNSVISNQLLEMVAGVSGISFWLVLAGCLTTARRTLKR